MPGLFGTMVFGDERTDRRIEVAVGIRARLGGAVRGLHHHVRLVIALPAIDRADERELIEHRRLLRQILANVDAGQLGRDVLERPANLARHRGLHVPGVDVRWAARHPQQNHRLVPRVRLRAQTQQPRQTQSGQAGKARFQHGATAVDRHAFADARVEERKRVRRGVRVGRFARHGVRVVWVVVTVNDAHHTSGVRPATAGGGTSSFMSHARFFGIVSSFESSACCQVTSLPV